MAILITRNWFPPDQSSKVAKRYVDWLKDNPPQPDIDKTLAISVTSAETGEILVYGIGQIGKGKEKEALINATKQNLFMAAGIENFRYKTEITLDFTEAYKILGMTAPEL
ncbi:MAG: hypothetical protein ACFE9R_10270 [Candidatus Hermodarchaeota archaeon]